MPHEKVTREAVYLITKNFSSMEKFQEKPCVHAGMGQFICWLQREVKFNNQRLTNDAIRSLTGISTSKLSEVKKGRH